MNHVELLRHTRDACGEAEALMGEFDCDQFDREHIGKRLDVLKDKLERLKCHGWDSTIETELSQACHRLKHRLGSRASEGNHSSLYDFRISLWHLRDHLETVTMKSRSG